MPKRQVKVRVQRETLASVTREHEDQFKADVQAAYDELRRLLGPNGGVNSAFDLVDLFTPVMRLVEKYSKFSGDKGVAKQQMALALMTRLVRDSPMSDDMKVYVQNLVETLGPSIIDNVISAANGTLFQKSFWEKFKCDCCSKQ